MGSLVDVKFNTAGEERDPQGAALPLSLDFGCPLWFSLSTVLNFPMRSTESFYTSNGYSQYSL